MVRLPTELRYVAKARMGMRIGQADRALPLDHQTHQTLAACEPHGAHRTRVEPVGGDEDEVDPGGIDEIDRTGVNGQAFLDAANDERHGLLQIGRFVEPLREVSQCFEHGE